MDNDAINPLDGRYFEKTRPLAPYFSEEALMKWRIMVECEFFIYLANSRLVGMRRLKPEEISRLRSLYKKFSEKSYQRIKEYERNTNHDVKAVEYFIKESLQETALLEHGEWIHFGLTSEDTNNLAHGLALGSALKKVILPELLKIYKTLAACARKYKDIPMLARTHGQPASPTTLGKEFAVFAARLKRQIRTLEGHRLSVKLNGATGNYNAFLVAYPKANWLGFSEKFIAHIGRTAGLAFETNLITTQIEPHDTYAELSDNMRRINVILLDLNQDIWRYVSDDYLSQRPAKGETGSSTMPHKVNPIDFENSEGNLGVANALFNHFSNKLPISRLQRDLSDSTVERTFGTAFGHSYLAYLSLEKGLGKIEANRKKIKEELDTHPEIIAEALQTILRRENYPAPYEALKEFSRGKKTSLADFRTFIDRLDIPPKLKIELKKITPASYTGLAKKITTLV